MSCKYAFGRLLNSRIPQEEEEEEEEDCYK